MTELLQIFYLSILGVVGNHCSNKGVSQWLWDRWSRV